MAMATSRAFLAPSRRSPHTSLPPTALHARQVAGDYCVFQLTPTTHHQGVCHPIDETKPPLSYGADARSTESRAVPAGGRSSTHALAKQPPPRRRLLRKQETRWGCDFRLFGPDERFR